MPRRLTSVWSRRPLPPPRTADSASEHRDGRRRFGSCHGVCKGGRLRRPAHPAPVPGAAHTRCVRPHEDKRKESHERTRLALRPPLTLGDDADASEIRHTPTGGRRPGRLTVAGTNTQSRSWSGFGDGIGPDEVGTGSNR